MEANLSESDSESSHQKQPFVNTVMFQYVLTSALRLHLKMDDVLMSLPDGL